MIACLEEGRDNTDVRVALRVWGRLRHEDDVVNAFELAEAVLDPRVRSAVLAREARKLARELWTRKQECGDLGERLVKAKDQRNLLAVLLAVSFLLCLLLSG